MTTTTTDVKALESRHVLQTYKRLPVVFERGSGTRLFDDGPSPIVHLRPTEVTSTPLATHLTYEVERVP